MSNHEQSNETIAELSGNTYYPPPPPPTTSQTQTLSEQTSTQQLHPSPQQIHEEQPQPQHQNQGQQAQQPPTEQQQQQQQQQPHTYIPPPPPPTQTDEKQSTSFPQVQHQPQLQQQPQSAYTIPAYDPANPVFAPPPTGQDGSQQQSGHHQDPGQPFSQQGHQQQYHQSPHPDQQHEDKKSSWGHRFKHLVSAGAAAPINSLAHKLGSQSFLPETLDKECDKAAAILKSFCTKGVYADPGAGQPPTSTDPNARESTSGLIDPTKEKPKNRVIVTIPPKVISKAVGLAIFTTLRAGFQVSGATGSGILIARLPDGSWSPPSGIQVHSVGGGFQIGLDIYDCVCVINSKEALAAFMNTRVSLGSDLAVVAGPYGAGGAVDFGAAMQRGRDQTGGNKVAGSSNTLGQEQANTASPHDGQQQQQQQSSTLKPGGGDSKRRSLSSSAFRPVFSYVKSRGFYAGIQVDGTVVVERKEANASFYGAALTVQQILQGQVPPQGPQNMWPIGARVLLETLRGAEAGVLGDHHPPPPPLGAPGQSGPGDVPPSKAQPGHTVAGDTSSGALPAYVDDGSHGHVGDVKYA